MNTNQERSQNQAAYRRLSDWINQTYSAGRFLAISEGQIVVDVRRFPELRALLEGMGKDPSQVLIIQAGVDYPESAVIFAGNGQR